MAPLFEDAHRPGRAGVWLGLDVARRIAATHGGTITADSDPGRASGFVVRLPRASALDVTPVVVDRSEAVALTPSQDAGRGSADRMAWHHRGCLGAPSLRGCAVTDFGAVQ
jgi:hypothetical protein